jgi:hypothetical protein
LIENIINILVFTQFKVFRKNSSALYLTVITSIIECLQLNFASTTHIITIAFRFDQTTSSDFWWKLQAYLARLRGTVSIAVICLSRSYHNQLRQISTFKLVQHRNIILLFIFVYFLMRKLTTLRDHITHIIHMNEKFALFYIKI